MKQFHTKERENSGNCACFTPAHEPSFGARPVPGRSGSDSPLVPEPSPSRRLHSDPLRAGTSRAPNVGGFRGAVRAQSSRRSLLGKRERVRGTAATATLRLRTPHGTVELFESPGRAGNLRELIMKASARLRMVLFAEFAMAALSGANANAEWWQHPHDKWYLKDDWKAAEVDRYGPTFTLQSPAAGGWVVVWGNNGVMLSAKGAGVMKEVD